MERERRIEQIERPHVWNARDVMPEREDSESEDSASLTSMLLSKRGIIPLPAPSPTSSPRVTVLL